MKYPQFVEPTVLQTESDETIEKKVSALLTQMTEDEIMNLCHGHTNPPGMQIANAGYLPGVPRLGVPEIRMFDGPAGVTSVYETTGLPVQEMLAASWDTKLAYKYGKVEGSENFAISGNTQLGSQYDVVRTPHFSRNKDMLGEDPFLTTAMAVEETKGIQEQHTMATLKHFGMASIGTDMQNATDQIVDEQTMHEIYFPPFEAAAREAMAASFMCCYNKFNGAYASANEYAQKTVMRDMWNYKGYIMSDWGANHALTTGKGMDMEMPSGTYNSNERLQLGIQKGRITWDDVVTAAHHVLYGLGMGGYLSLVELDDSGRVREETGRTEPIRMKDRYADSVKAGLLDDNAAICKEIAQKGAVLLKNEKKALPLTEQDYTDGNSIAMIGLGANYLLSGAGQERSYGRISQMKAPVDEVKRLAGENANIIGEVGMDFFGKTIPAKYLFQDEDCTYNGLTCTYGVDASNKSAGMFPGMPHGNDDEGKTPMPPMGGDKKEQPPVDIGGGGREFKGVAASDEDENSDLPPFMPPWTNSLAADMEGHETGSFCCLNEDIDFTTGTQDYKNGPNGRAFPKGSAYTWDGYLKVPHDGEYTLILQAIGGNTDFKIKLDGENFVSVGSTELREGAQWPWGSLVATKEGMELHGGTAFLKADTAYPIRLCVNATIAQKDLQVRLSWITPEQKRVDYEAALKAAKQAKKILLFLCDGYSFKPLGAPAVFAMNGLPSLEVPEIQQKLVRDIKAVMQPEAQLILVHNNGQIFALGSVEPMADAIVNIWTPGQEGGAAVAEILLGKINPSGKMAMTIPAKDEDTLVTDIAGHRTRRYTGYEKGGKQYVDFDEGIFTGYRWYDKTGVKPLYAFGHGLSYTSFAYSALKVNGTDVTFTVTNTGDVAGTEIAQVYLGEAKVSEGIQMAKKQLCGFARLEDMQPGESRTVTVSIPERSFLYWDSKAELLARSDGTMDKWVRAAGKRKVFVGGSSDALVLQQEIMNY